MEENISLHYVPSIVLNADEIKHNFAKRTFDILFSSLVLILGFPIFFLIALLVRFSSKGAVIYGHERIGRGGKPFRCYKFRTMRVNADKLLIEILKNDPELKKEWEETRKLKNDPRVTAIGRFLRMTSLDELPQFWNTLKGDMSIVGPRPVVKSELVKYFGRSTPLILSIRPGLTGLWQISGRSNTTYEERIRFDQDYVLSHSFIGDLKIVFDTIPAMFRGAY